MKKYYQMLTAGRTAEIHIYGDITSVPWTESDVSAYPIVTEIDALDADEIRVYINSYGGEYAEGLAIVNALNRNKAKIVTIVDGFACSAAADIFMAGDERRMAEASLLFVHRVGWMAAGNADDLRKAAEALDKMDQAYLQLYMSKVKITEKELWNLFVEETWILPEEALTMGFATEIIKDEVAASASHSARLQVLRKMTAKAATVHLDITNLEAVRQMCERIEEIAKQIRTPAEPQDGKAQGTQNQPELNPTQRFFAELLK